jgi:acetolactate synthase-1/2/3 large subunit
MKMPQDAQPAATTATRIGGHVLADALAAQQIRHAFLVPGESFLPVLDGLHAVRDRVQLVTCRMETGAAHMAEAVGKLTGRPAAAFVTRGPGACHAAIGVHVAQQDSTPMLLFVGQIPFAETDRESFQEVDYRRMFSPLAKWVTQIDDAPRIPEVVAHAVDVATTGRPGPVVIALSEEMQQHSVSVADIGPAPVAPPHPDPAAMQRMQEMIAASRRPLVILGGVWSADGRRAIRDVLIGHDLPVAVAFRRQSLFDCTQENYVGDLGVGSDPALVQAAKRADLILAFGTRLGEPVTQGYTLLDLAGSTPIVHVYPEASEIGRVFRPALGVVSDLTAFAASFARMTPLTPRWDNWTRELRALRVAAMAVPDYPGPLNLAACLHELQGLLDADAVMTCDAGNFAAWPARFMAVRERQVFIGPTNGAMGYAVPAAVGAKLLNPKRQAVAFVGDGGVLMTGQELATATLHGVAPVVLIFNNGMYGTIRMYQERAFPGRVVGTSLSNPDFVAWASAFGAHAERVDTTRAFAPAFRRAVASGRPAVIELRTDPEQITSRSTLAELRGGQPAGPAGPAPRRRKA